MKYVGQTGCTLKTFLASTIVDREKAKQFYTFLYQQFEHTGHSSNNILVQPEEKLTYKENSSLKFTIIKYTKRNYMYKLLYVCINYRLLFNWDSMMLFIKKVICLKCQFWVRFPFWSFGNVTPDSMVQGKRKITHEKFFAP